MYQITPTPPQSSWLRTTLLYIALITTVTACSATPQTPPPPPTVIDPTTAATSATELPLFNDAIKDIQIASETNTGQMAWDAAPDPEATTIYFTAQRDEGLGLFSVPATGGEATPIAVGNPWQQPQGLAIASNGQTIYVADRQASASDGKVGQIFSVPAAGGAPTPLDSTAGTAPRGLEVVPENGTDVIYFTGIDPSNGQPAVMRVAPQDGSLQVIASGAPLVEPVGVTANSQGVVYVGDQAAGGNGKGRVFEINAGQVKTLVAQVRGGNPMGVTLTLDESLLLVSALDETEESSRVYVVQLESGQLGLVTKVIAENVGSGGVHRARNKNVLAWAGIPATPPRTIIYRISF